jgi:hypothetical protein
MMKRMMRRECRQQRMRQLRTRIRLSAQEHEQQGERQRPSYDEQRNRPERSRMCMKSVRTSDDRRATLRRRSAMAMPMPLAAAQRQRQTAEAERSERVMRPHATDRRRARDMIVCARSPRMHHRTRTDLRWADAVRSVRSAMGVRISTQRLWSVCEKQKIHEHAAGVHTRRKRCI